MKNKTSQNLKNMTRIAFFTAILSVLSQIFIPSPSGMPLTLQTFGVCLCGYFLGVKKALCPVAVYLVAGICGIPVFAGFSGGIGHLLGASGGFLIGFLPLAALCGAGSKSRTSVTAICLGIAGLVICHISGIFWFCTITQADFSSAFVTASAVYIPKDIVSVFGAYFFSKLLGKYIK